jgi:hypothetical protein
VFYSLLVVVFVGALILGYKKWQSLPEAHRAGFSKKALIYGGAAIVLVLVVAGKAHWLMGVLAGLLALAGRVAQFAQYIPLFKKVMGQEEVPPEGSSHASVNSEMSKGDAAEILGVDSDASVDDVRMAHKRLIQKLHPDRGGSDALAKQINMAKDVLLK